MAAPNSTLPDNKEEQDSLYNPGDQNYREKMGAGYIGSGTDQLESFANDPNNHDLKSSEESPGKLENNFYVPSPGGKAQPITLKGFFKKKGPIGGIIGLLLGTGGAFSIMLAPGLGIVQLKEVLTGDLNDQLAAFDIRSDAMFKAKLKGLQASGSVCSNVVKIRCQFGSMNAKQVAKFEKAGFTNIEVDEKAFGRVVVTSMTAPNGVEIKNPQDLINERRDPLVRTAMNKVHNPMYMSLTDNTAIKTLVNRFKTSKGPKLTGVTVEELDSSFDANTTGEELSGGAKVEVDGDGKRFITVDGETIPETDPRFNQLAGVDGFDAKAEAVKTTGVKAVTGVLSSGAKGVSIIGAADTACTVYNTARTVAAAAKQIRAIELAQYAFVVLGTADQIKAGTATPEQVAYMGNIITTIDNNPTITDELSETTTGSNSADAIKNAKERPNPFYKKSGFDSPGFAVASYNDAPTLTTRSQQYMVGGGLTGTLSTVTDSIADTFGGRENIRGSCGVIQSPIVRVGGFIVGIAAAIGSVGTSTIVSVGASLAVGFALPFLEAALADIVAGDVVNSKTKGVDSVNATFSGTATALGGVAQARGMKPAKKEDLEKAARTNARIKNEYIAQATYEAKDTPLDISNQYSFLGSFARSVNPTFTSAKGGFAESLAALPKFLSTSLASIVPTTNAAVAYNPDRFSKCEDEGYDELGIAADIFCNVRYVMSDEELSLDPNEVLTYMLGEGQGNSTAYIDENGQAIDGDYKTFMTNCVDRTDGWGETTTEGGDIGLDCMAEDTKHSYFRVFTMDRSVNESMDDEDVVAEATGTGEVASPVSASFSIPDDFGPRPAPCGGCSTWHQGLDLFTSDGAVFSVMDGEVIAVGNGGNNILQIKHADGLISSYWHMFPADVKVKVGDTVTAGQRIGKMGKSGQATGVHLHIELDISKVGDKKSYERYGISTGGYNPGDRIDPAKYFKLNGIKGF